MGLFGTILEKLGLGKSTDRPRIDTGACAHGAPAGSDHPSEGNGRGGCCGQA